MDVSKEIVMLTGGAGFIGSVLARELYNSGEKSILLVDRMGHASKWLNLRTLPLEGYFHADEFWTSIPEETWGKVKVIFHMGACSSTTETNLDYLLKNNFEFSQRLYLKAQQYKIPFIYASSAATYGDGDYGYSDDHAGISKLVPLNPYGYSKQLFDQWVLKQSDKTFPCIGVKFFNVYGPNEYHKGSMRSVVVQAYEQIIAHGKVFLFESYKEWIPHGHQKRDFVYVKDVVNWMLALWKANTTKINGIYNMGSGTARTFEDLAKATFSVFEMKPQIEFKTMPESLRAQYQYFTEAKMEKLWTTLKSDKVTSLEDGVRDYVQNYLQKDNQHH